MTGGFERRQFDGRHTQVHLYNVGKVKVIDTKVQSYLLIKMLEYILSLLYTWESIGTYIHLCIG